jgi:hypothetical protein
MYFPVQLHIKDYLVVLPPSNVPTQAVHQPSPNLTQSGNNPREAYVSGGAHPEFDHEQPHVQVSLVWQSVAHEDLKTWLLLESSWYVLATTFVLLVTTVGACGYFTNIRASQGKSDAGVMRKEASFGQEETDGYGNWGEGDHDDMVTDNDGELGGGFILADDDLLDDELLDDPSHPGWRDVFDKLYTTESTNK